jgi:glycosyltransferase involved in cell wall biosynthesis
MDTTNVKPSLSFVWQGFSGRYGQWKDGLWGAMKEIEKTHIVFYQEPEEEIKGDVILYWEAPVTECGKDRENYLRIKNNPKPKILLFAGGQIKKEWVNGFDILLVESKINADECNELGIPNMTAFGVNSDIMKPQKQPKIFDAVFPSTCAGWKRQGLFSRALQNKGVICGRFQPEDPIGFILAREQGTLVLPELSQEAVAGLYNASHCCVNTSEYWGGGQRTTLEAMSCGIPVIVMSDSPKNIEYVKESNAGLVCEPDEHSIRKAIEEIKTWTDEEKRRGIDYINSKWTHHHYANNILEAINKINNK